MTDMLRIMDVASALRRERETAVAQLDVDTTKQRLRERLLATAAAAGEPVTEAEVDVAIERYFGEQHRYADPPRSWATFWAHVWVLRVRILLVALAFVALVGGAALATSALLRRAPVDVPQRPTPPAPAPAATSDAATPDEPAPSTPADALAAATAAFAAERKAVEALASSDSARAFLAELTADGEIALTAADTAALTAIVQKLRELRQRLGEVYEVRIVTRPGELSGVDRYHGGKLSGLYLIVEAVTADGRVLTRSIRDAETGAVRRVQRWGEQVPQAVWDRIVADKRADGVVDEQPFARKVRGEADERVVLPGSDGKALRRARQITKW